MAEWQQFLAFCDEVEFAENELLLMHTHQMAYVYCTLSIYALWRCVVYRLHVVCFILIICIQYLQLTATLVLDAVVVAMDHLYKSVQ